MATKEVAAIQAAKQAVLIMALLTVHPLDVYAVKRSKIDAKCGFAHRYISNDQRFRNLHNRAERSRSALVTTDTELRLIAALAMMGESSTPKNG